MDPLLERSEANRRCFDCQTPCHEHPWISVQHGIVLCINCAGSHRALGVSVSFVRSLKLDRVAAKELAYFDHGGNAAMALFVESNGGLRTWRALSTEARYYSPVADLYRRRLEVRTLGGSDLPNDLRVVTPPKSLTVPALQPKRAAKWTPDSTASRCEICTKKFTILRRRHHCRRCGRCVCEHCSPRECFRPIPPVVKPCRHCTKCVAVPGESFDPRFSNAAS